MNLNLLWRQATAGQKNCPECGQAMIFADSDGPFCPECDGLNTCPDCAGSGVDDGDVCVGCAGDGVYRPEKD